MKPQRLNAAAGAVRFGLAFFAAFVLPIVYPAMAAHRTVVLAYALVSMVVQYMIANDLGGAWRTVLGGILDMAMVTFLVQRAGSAHTMVIGLYFVGCTISTLSSGPKMGLIIATAAVVMYATVVVSESFGILPYGPDAPAWAQFGTPRSIDVAIFAIVVAGLLLLTTSVVAMLMVTVQRRNDDLLRANEKLGALTRQDALTKLYNRRHVIDYIEEGLAWLKRGRPMAVVMLDLDKFKRINDTRGHLAGDELLRQISTALVESTREIDIAGRYGGDEFVVVLPDTSLEEAKIAAKRFIDAIRNTGRLFDPTHPVTASAGLTIAGPDDDVASILKRADQRAYAAKRLGGDRVNA